MLVVFFNDLGEALILTEELRCLATVRGRRRGQVLGHLRFALMNSVVSVAMEEFPKGASLAAVRQLAGRCGGCDAFVETSRRPYKVPVDGTHVDRMAAREQEILVHPLHPTIQEERTNSVPR